MATTYKAVLRKKKNENYGILNIRKTKNRIPSYISMKINIPLPLWNSKQGEVRKTTQLDYKKINKSIKNKIKELELINDSGVVQSKYDEDSFISFFENCIKNIANQGSKLKYNTVLVKLQKYLKSKGLNDLRFTEINENFISEYHVFLKESLSNNTANHYLKTTKQILDKAIRLNYVNYFRHPFINIVFKNQKKNVVALTEKELSKLLNKHIPETHPLNNTRNKFVCQIFLQGMRVSDLQQLKFSNIKGEYIEYTMFKTKKYMKVFISEIAWKIIIYQFKQHCIQENITLTNIEVLEKDLTNKKKEAEIFHTKWL